MSYQAIFILEVYAYLVVAVTCKSRSLRFASLIWSSHAGLYLTVPTYNYLRIGEEFVALIFVVHVTK